MLQEPVFEPVEQGKENADDPEGLLAAAASLREGEHSSSVMVALYPDPELAAELAIPGGEAPRDLHLTLAFLGKTHSLNREATLRAVRDWAAGCPPLEGEISGIGRFADTGDGPVTYLSVDLPELPHQRQSLVDVLDAAGSPPRRDHGFTPHMTLDYAHRRPKVPKPIPLRFDRVTLSWGDEAIALPLSGHPLAEAIVEGLVDHAKGELERAGLFSQDSDYEGMLGDEIMKIVKTFADGGHSGGSAAMTVAALEKLLRYQPLTPLTSDPEEWIDRQAEMGGKPVWQSRRNPAAFSYDGGQTWEIMEAAHSLQEGKWEASLHPRWPKGSPRAGEFMKVGQRFIGSDGKEWQIAHIAGGKVIANRAEGKYAQTETGIFHAKKVSGAQSPSGEETHVIADAKKEAAPRAVKGGKGATSNVTIVDPYVAPKTHDPTISVPSGSKISAEEWQRFGELDQEHYAELMGRFGKYNPGKAKALIDEAYKDYEAEIQSIVKNAYSAQYGSSTGFTLSLTGIFKHITGKDKKELAKLDAQRQRALELQGRHKDVIAWDLYNRTRSPDVAVFHKSNDPNSYWDEFITGNRPVMSGLSQSFNFGANFGFGSTTLATPLAIRHVLMSSYSAQPIPGQTHFAGELEIATAEQLKIDKRSLSFSLHDITANQKKWLMGVTKAPASGQTVDTFRDALKSGEMLPTPPAPPDIQMQGQGQKLWIDPPPEAAEFAKSFAGKLPAQQEQLLDPGKLDKSGPWAFKDAGGLPKPTIAKESGYKPGDYMMGLKGTLYVIVEDPGDSTGFGLRYVKIENGQFTGESYNFDGGGTNNYYKLDIHFDLPDPHKEAKATDLFDPHAWVNGEKEAFLGKLTPGEKFKVNGNPYEIKAQLSGAHTQITDLASGKVGTINTDYKTHVLVPKEGYTPAKMGEEMPKLEPTKGLTLAWEGKKHIITNVLKDGTIKAKPTGGGKTVAIASDDSALDHLYDPSAHKIGAKVKASELSVGQVFHGGRGSTQRPYLVTSVDGKSVTWRSLDTGEEGTFTKAKQVRLLDDAETPEPDQPSNTPKGPQSHYGFLEGEEVAIQGMGQPGIVVGSKEMPNGDPAVEVEVNGNSLYFFGPSTLESVKAGPTGFNPDDYVAGNKVGVEQLDVGAKFFTADTPFELIDKTDKAGMLTAKNLKTGWTEEIPFDQQVRHLLPKDSVEVIPHDQLQPNDATTLGNLEPGDFFNIDGEAFKVISKPDSLEQNVVVAKVLPSGATQALSDNGSFPDKLVYYKGSEPPEWVSTATDIPSGGFPDLMVEGGFQPYKSKYGSGGKYTHDKIGEMTPGTVFRDKGGKLWKVKESDHIVVVTDGKVLFSADASLRGRVVQEDFVDETGPVKGPHADPAEVAAASGLIPNSAALSMDELPAGATVLVNGNVHTIKEPAEKGDEVTQLAAMTELPDGSESMLGPAIIPDQVKMPPKADSVGAKSQGDAFPGAGGKGHTVIAKALDGMVVQSQTGGGIVKVPFSTPPESIDADSPTGIAAKPEVSTMPGNTKISDLDDGAVFSTPGGGLKTVIAKTIDGEVVVMEGTKPGGTMETLPQNAIINSNQVQPPAGAVQTDWSPAVQQALEQAGATMDDVPLATGIESYKSKWGSGGKYQHYQLSELEPGTTFVDKKGESYTIIGDGPKGTVLILGSTSGSLSLGPPAVRVKQL